ncbi:STN domain-containing protein [Natronogracilivirga saccharolytica]|uniref:STN domain-containing protein n=1 Tax=Natronogracilivirga saccharolytica TaxID=2812953 RepID=A0A8J7RLY7_9BACT|nr:STN domain-containing protein [Natronogracilivirga saccharolytica]MBP3192543.1 STN domain-containing protein [Natronogracilivirga saccharolytica]
MCALLIAVMTMLPVMQSGDPVYSFEFHDEPLERALYLISEKTGTDFLYESELTDGVMVRAVFREKPLRDILDELLEPEGLEARRIRTGIYVIRHSLRQHIRPLAEVPAGAGSRVDALRSEAMQPLVLPFSAAFDEPVPLSEIILRRSLPE